MIAGLVRIGLQDGTVGDVNFESIYFYTHAICTNGLSIRTIMCSSLSVVRFDLTMDCKD